MSRGKNIIQNVLTLKQSYEYYIKDIPEDSKFHQPYKIYRAICEDANKELSRSITEDGYFFKMPYRLGVLRIQKRKVDLSNLKPDFGLYNKSENHLKNKHLNEHSGGWYVRFYWNKRIATLVKNKAAYTFIPTRYNKRHLSGLIKSQGVQQTNKYFE